MSARHVRSEFPARRGEEREHDDGDREACGATDDALFNYWRDNTSIYGGYMLPGKEEDGVVTVHVAVLGGGLQQIFADNKIMAICGVLLGGWQYSRKKKTKVNIKKPRDCVSSAFLAA